MNPPPPPLPPPLQPPPPPPSPIHPHLISQITSCHARTPHLPTASHCPNAHPLSTPSIKLKLASRSSSYLVTNITARQLFESSLPDVSRLCFLFFHQTLLWIALLMKNGLQGMNLAIVSWINRCLQLSMVSSKINITIALFDSKTTCVLNLDKNMKKMTKKSFKFIEGRKLF